ncbi:MAG: RHS repeat-associated core domain-containing protein [Roseiflexaceae bacterium]
MPRTGSIPQTTLDFTGQHRDDTGLIYLHARYYNPQLGRMLSPDTMIPEPVNHYSYVRNNPLRWTDPSGHCLGWLLRPSRHRVSLRRWGDDASHWAHGGWRCDPSRAYALRPYTMHPWCIHEGTSSHSATTNGITARCGGARLSRPRRAASHQIA